MTFKTVLQYSYAIEAAFCLLVFVAMLRRRLVGNYRVLSLLLLTRFISRTVLIAIMYHRKSLNIAMDRALLIYFADQWMSAVVDSALIMLLIYRTFWEAMRPLEGIHNIGKIIFRWVSGVSFVFSVALALGPHDAAPTYRAMVSTRLADGTNILTLCLLLFVCFAISPLGLTYRSRIFGISLGLGVMTSIDLIQSGWLASTQAGSLYSPIYLVHSLGAVMGLMIWMAYFLREEPERALILLPTTSPFFFWNRVSEVLGDDPGHVAVGGIKPSMLAAAELKVLSATRKQGVALPESTEIASDTAESFPSAASQ